MADEEQDGIPTNAEAAFNDDPPAPEDSTMPPDVQEAWEAVPENAADTPVLPQAETTFPTDSIPDDTPKFFTPPEIQTSAPTAEIDFQVDQLPPEALNTLARLQAEAQPQRSEQQQRVHAASQQRAQQRRQRFGQPPTPQEQQSPQDVWASLQDDQFDDSLAPQEIPAPQRRRDQFDDSLAGREFPAPEGPSNVDGGGGQSDGMEKLAQVGERILAKIDQIDARFVEMKTAIDSLSESMREISSTYG